MKNETTEIRNDRTAAPEHTLDPQVHEGHGHHHHDHEDDCGCGHDHHCHDHEDSCGCGHDHPCHDHEGGCGCGWGCGCGCGHDHNHTADAAEIRQLELQLSIGSVLLLAALVLQQTPLPAFIPILLFAASYLVIGWPVLRETLEHLPKGRIFDENLLMTVASVGAFALGDFAEAVVVVMLYQVGELLQGLAVSKSRKNIAATMDIRPDHADLLEADGSVRRVAPEEVPAGSRILIRPGERIPLDCTIIEGASALDTAALTGESLPREVGCGDAVLSGSINLQGMLTARTTGSFADSTVQRILRLTQESAAKKSTAEKFITRFARVYTPIVFALAVLIAVLPPVLGLGLWRDWLYRGLVFLVVSCPCALVISVPVGFLAGMGGAARHGVLLKGGAVLDRLRSVSTVVFDKTGTLTRGVFTVSRVSPAEGVAEQELLHAAALCESGSTHPIARSVMEYCAHRVTPPSHGDAQELAGMGVSVRLSGSVYLAGNPRLLQAHGIDVPLPKDAVGTLLYLACDGRFLGTVEITDTVKDGVPAALATLRRLGVRRLALLSGDRLPAVRQLAEQLQLDDWRAELLPQDKVLAFDTLCTGEGAHLFVGDGINDAPLLARADVGIAMGGIGSDAAVEAADCVLMRDDIEGVALALRCARRTHRIVRQNIAFALGAKLAVLIATALGYAPMWLAIFADVGVALLCVLNATRAIAVK